MTVATPKVRDAISTFFPTSTAQAVAFERILFKSMPFARTAKPLLVRLARLGFYGTEIPAGFDGPDLRHVRDLGAGGIFDIDAGVI